MSKKRNTGQEVLEAIQDIKQSKGKKKVVLSLLWCLGTCIAFADDVSVKPSSKEIVDAFTAEEVELLHLTNKERAHKGLPPLKMNKNLVDVARDQSANMARHRHLSHTVKGESFEYRIKQSGYPMAKAGENVARSKQSFSHVIHMWMKSPGHRKNILNHHFKEMGIGIATVPNGDRYFTQVFGTQKGK